MIVVILLGLLLFSLTTTGVSNQIYRWIEPEDSLSALWIMDWILISLFPIYSVFIWFQARNVVEKIKPRVRQYVSPGNATGLILFLSPNSRVDKELVEQLLEGKEKTLPLKDLKFRQQFRGSWRMPLEAIATHLACLTHVVVVTSSDRGEVTNDRDLGTYREYVVFKDLVELGFANQVRVSQFGQAFSETETQAIDPKYGVDFENVETLYEHVEAAFESLESLGVPSDKIVIDITGGQKIPGIAGSLVSLVDGRRFQYVSTHDYVAREYDLTFLS